MKWVSGGASTRLAARSAVTTCASQHDLRLHVYCQLTVVGSSTDSRQSEAVAGISREAAAEGAAEAYLASAR